MKSLSKDHYIQSQMMMINGLLAHTKDNLEDTCFEDCEELHDLLQNLHLGTGAVVLRMKALIKDHDDCDCC